MSGKFVRGKNVLKRYINLPDKSSKQICKMTIIIFIF